MHRMERAELKGGVIPKGPGVYFFLGARREILYIGKATSLKSRITSYFDNAISEKRSVLIEKMVREANCVEWVSTDSVLEALLLETNLIRTHRPSFNTRSKDDKSFNHVVITKEDFPKVMVVRGKDLLNADSSQYPHIFGPFPNSTLFKTAMKIVRKLFQFYDSGAIESRSAVVRGKIDFNRQIGLYPDKISKREYSRTIKHIVLFFEGKKGRIIQELDKEMHRLAQKEKFEEAHIIKKRIFALEHIQDVSLIKDEVRGYTDEKSYRIEAYDVAHLQGSAMVGAMVVCENGQVQKSEYRKFKIQSTRVSNDTKALREILERRFTHPEWTFPALIVVDGSTAQKNTAEKVLKQFKLVIPVVGVVKDEHHKPKRLLGAVRVITEHRDDILLANAEAHRFAITYHREKRRLPKPSPHGIVSSTYGNNT
jgi:excinuclease ABC subunit C